MSISTIDAGSLPHRSRATCCPTSDADQHCEALEALALVPALPERKRTFLALKVAGFSYDEIAAELGVSWPTVNRQLVRARAAIREARDGIEVLRKSRNRIG